MYISDKKTVLHCETLRKRINLQPKLLSVICLLLLTTKLEITVTNEFKRIVYLKKNGVKKPFFFILEITIHSRTMNDSSEIMNGGQ